VALVRKRLGLEVVAFPGSKGQFEVIVDGKTIAERGGNWLTRRFGAGYPDLDRVIERLEKGK
jgi:predicted Rdx family selenoprotein